MFLILTGSLEMHNCYGTLATSTAREGPPMATVDECLDEANRWLTSAATKEPTDPASAAACAQISQAYTALAHFKFLQRGPNPHSTNSGDQMYPSDLH